jgi:hypothetical protein
MNKLVLIYLFMILFANCEGQSKKQLPKNEPVNCNRTVYGSSKYIKSLPPYICIPDGFIIDDYARASDFNGDGKDDFIAVKYNKKEDNQVDGDSTYWNFYMRSKADTVYSLKMTLANIVPPFIKDVSYEYLLSHPIAAKLFEDYPQRMSHNLGFQVSFDTIRISYKFQDSYGKSFVFVNDQDNWYLQNVEYFIGELPMYWWKENDFYFPLNDKIKIIETKKPRKKITINNFNLKAAFKYREDEWSHLSDWHINRIDKTKWSTIEEVKFGTCQGIELPDDWIY